VTLEMSAQMQIDLHASNLSDSNQTGKCGQVTKHVKVSRKSILGFYIHYMQRDEYGETTRCLHATRQKINCLEHAGLQEISSANRVRYME
jgi:hypothetical protein